MGYFFALSGRRVWWKDRHHLELPILLNLPMAWVPRCSLASVLARSVKHNRAAVCTRCNSVILLSSGGKGGWIKEERTWRLFFKRQVMLTSCWLKGGGKTCVVKCAERVWSAEIPAQSEYQSGQGMLVSDVQLRISRMVNAGITFILLSALVSSWSWQHCWELWFLSPHSWRACSFSYSSSNLLGETCSSCLFLFVSLFSPLHPWWVSRGEGNHSFDGELFFQPLPHTPAHTIKTNNGAHRWSRPGSERLIRDCRPLLTPHSS